MKQPLFSIPIASTSFGSDAAIEFDGGDLKLKFEYRQGNIANREAVHFRKVRAFRHRAEPYCTAWHIESAYDHVVELTDSDWVKEVIGAALNHHRTGWVMKHYMIYLDSLGCLEVIAEAAELGIDRAGMTEPGLSCEDIDLEIDVEETGLFEPIARGMRKSGRAAMEASGKLTQGGDTKVNCMMNSSDSRYSQVQTARYKNQHSVETA